MLRLVVLLPSASNLDPAVAYLTLDGVGSIIVFQSDLL